MRAVFVGWGAGYVMGIASTVALTFLVTRLRDTSFVERWFARDVPGVALAVPVFLGSVVAWTIVGLILGSLYVLGDFEERAGALGAPSLLFLLIIAALAWLPLPVLVLVRRRYWWLWSSLSLCFLVLFGWAMPLLAER